MGAAPKVAAGARAGASPRQRGGRRPSEVQGAHDGEARVLAVAAAVVVRAGAGVAGGGGGRAGQWVGEHEHRPGGAPEWPQRLGLARGARPSAALLAILGDQDEVVHARPLPTTRGCWRGLQRGQGRRGRGEGALGRPWVLPRPRGVLPRVGGSFEGGLGLPLPPPPGAGLWPRPLLCSVSQDTGDTGSVYTHMDREGPLPKSTELRERTSKGALLEEHS